MVSFVLEKLGQGLPEEVNLLAVSKGHSAEAIRRIASCGQCDFGESRLQEAIPKQLALADLKDIRWHFIGRLQSNKVRAVVRAFQVIHSVDSVPLAERISRISMEENLCPEVFLQVKFRNDPSKGGFEPDHVREIFPNLIRLPSIHLVGLMTIPPLHISLEDKTDLFKECRDFTDQLGLKECSMGMSRDWQQAVQAGTTWLRLGSALFGERSKNDNVSTDIIKYF